MEQNIKNYLVEEAARIQPDVVKNEICDPKDIALFERMTKVYKELAAEDLSFNLFFTSKDTGQTHLLFRICDIEDQSRYQKTCNSYQKLMWEFLCHGGFIKFLEGNGFIKILDKGKHVTHGEEIREELAAKGTEGLAQSISNCPECGKKGWDGQRCIYCAK